MPRRSRGPHLYLKKRAGGISVWYIRDGGRRISTGCTSDQAAGAEEALARHIAAKHQPDFGSRDPARIRVADVIGLYDTDRVGQTARPEETVQMCERINEFFGSRVCADVTATTCAAYVRWRGHEGKPVRGEPTRRHRAVVPATARRELEVLRSALNHAFRSSKLAVPIPVSLPDKAAPRERWLTRDEVARLLLGTLGFQMVQFCDVKTRKIGWKAWDRRKDRINRHAARFVLLGLYTATRHDAILALGWRLHTGGGYVALDQGRIYRKTPGKAETRKRQPPVPITPGLAAHLRRWRRLDGERLFVVSWDGARLAKMRRAFKSAVRLAGLDDAVTPHILRHTCVTWIMQQTGDAWEAAGFAGMTVDMVQRAYGHQSPDHLRRATAALSGRSDTGQNTGRRM